MILIMTNKWNLALRCETVEKSLESLLMQKTYAIAQEMHLVMNLFQK